MKLQVLQESFSKALSTSLRFTSAKAQLPVLANILLSAKKNSLLISATNLEISASLSVGAKIEEEGEITVPAKTITDLVTNLERGQVTIETEKELLKITTDDFESAVSGMNASDFPAIPSSLDKEAFSVSKDVLLNALSKVVFAVSTDETRPVLTGVLAILRGSELLFVATDGFRLSQVKIKIPEVKEETVILPKSSLSELPRLIGESDAVDVQIKKTENQVLFGVANGVLATRTIEGEFPAFEKIIPKESLYKVNLSKDDLLRSVKLASVFARDSANVIKLEVEKGSVGFYAESARSGKQHSKIDAKVLTEGNEKLTIAFNYRFLEEFLQVVEGESVDLSFTDANAPGVFMDPKDPNFLHIIMPVRI